MKIHNEFIIPLPPAEAWQILNDIPRVANCVPGAKLIEQKDDKSYVGTVAVRLGPVSLSFKGVFTYKEIDENAHRVLAEASGNEQKARGSARADVEFVLTSHQAGTRVDVDTDVQLAGSIAQYARGGTLVQSTAQVLMNQFAKNLANEFGTRPVSAMRSAAAGDDVGARRQERTETETPRRSAAAEVSGLTLLWQGMWHAVRSRLRHAFGKGR